MLQFLLVLRGTHGRLTRSAPTGAPACPRHAARTPAPHRAGSSAHTTRISPPGRSARGCAVRSARPGFSAPGWRAAAPRQSPAAGALAAPLARKSARFTPSALASRHSTATVGLVRFRSIWDSIDLETPARRDRSSSDSCWACRSAWSAPPTAGGPSDWSGRLGDVGRGGLRHRHVFVIVHEPFVMSNMFDLSNRTTETLPPGAGPCRVPRPSMHPSARNWMPSATRGLYKRERVDHHAAGRRSITHELTAGK